VAFNAHELGRYTGDDALLGAAGDLASALDERWDAGLHTWIDAGESAMTSGHVRTLDALLATLVSSDAAKLDVAFNELVDPSAYDALFGPTGVHREEAAFAPDSYWRGSAWPQVSYLLWVAARRAERDDVAAGERSGLRRWRLRLWHQPARVGDRRRARRVHPAPGVRRSPLNGAGAGRAASRVCPLRRRGRVA